MAEAVGNEVVALRRVRFGPVRLGELGRGQRAGGSAPRSSVTPALEGCGRRESGDADDERGATLRGSRRGAGRAQRGEAILAATEELMRELLERNELEPEAMVSCIFTTTDDLDAEFPAVAARGSASTACRCSAPARSPCPARWSA